MTNHRTNGRKLTTCLPNTAESCFPLIYCIKIYIPKDLDSYPWCNWYFRKKIEVYQLINDITVIFHVEITLTFGLTKEISWLVKKYRQKDKPIRGVRVCFNACPARTWSHRTSRFVEKEKFTFCFRFNLP